MDCSLVRTLVQRYVSAARGGPAAGRERDLGPRSAAPAPGSAAAASPGSLRAWAASGCWPPPGGRAGRWEGPRSLHPRASDGSSAPTLAPTPRRGSTAARLPGAPRGWRAPRGDPPRLRSGPAPGGMFALGLRLPCGRLGGGESYTPAGKVLISLVRHAAGGFRSEVWDLFPPGRNQSDQRPPAFLKFLCVVRSGERKAGRGKVSFVLHQTEGKPCAG